MPVVITCPECQQKARVPDTMLGKSVKCPECGATFTVAADGVRPAGPPMPTVAPAPPVPLARPPLPADIDSLRAVRSGSGVQLIAQCIYAAALALFLLAMFILFTASVSSGPVFGPSSATGIGFPALLSLLATALMLVASTLNIVGASICVLAPPAHVARGLAIAALVLTLIAFEQMILAFSRWFFLMDDMAGRFGRFGPQFWLIIFWVVEIARLCVLATFWHAMSRTLRDNRGANFARRLAIAAPILQLFLAVAWTVIATIGVIGQEIIMLALFGWLAAQLLVVLAGIGVVARLWRRLKAVVPAGT